MTFLHLKTHKRFLISMLIVGLYTLLTCMSFASHGAISYIYKEDFNSATSKSWNISSTSNNIKLTDDGHLKFDSYSSVQSVRFTGVDTDKYLNFGIEFDFCINQMGNEGSIDTPIFFVSPRATDASLNNSYQLTYHLETYQSGAIVSNQYFLEWEIINTALPAGQQSLGTGYQILNEDTQYRGRLSIQNTLNNNVAIDFYLNGPGVERNAYVPLISVVDDSSKKILKGTQGVSFGTEGALERGWGENPIVQLNQMIFYDLYNFDLMTEQLESYYESKISVSIPEEDVDLIRYLVDRGIADPTLAPYKHATVGLLLEALETLNTGNYDAALAASGGNENALITRKIASEMFYAYTDNKTLDNGYMTIPSDLRTSDKAQHYAYQTGLLELDDQNRFNSLYVLNELDLYKMIGRYDDCSQGIQNQSLSIAEIFASHAVLQRDEILTVWGKGMSGDTVTVSFLGGTYTAKVVEGQWELTLPAHGAGGPYQMTIKDSSNSILLTDLYMGDVYIVAGQSNAEMTFGETDNATQVGNEVLADNDIRFYYNKHRLGVTPRDDADGVWYTPVDWIVDASPAIGTYFANELYNMDPDLKDVKIGLIRLTYGGSSIEMFLPPSAVPDTHIQEQDLPIISGYWNGFMDNVAPFKIKGLLYYQGENSTQLEYSYEPLLREYIQGVRTEFEDPDLPILLVQISGYGDNYYASDADSWPIIRDIQKRVADTTEGVYIVASIDLSDENPLEIHPTLKLPIGQRLAHVALTEIYGRTDVIRSPEVSGVSKGGKYFRIEVDHVGTGLKAINSDFKDAFEVLDENGLWQEASYRINPDLKTILVWSDAVSDPQGVRYAYRNYPNASVFNSYNLPLFPFSSRFDTSVVSDDFESTTNFQLKLDHHKLQTFDAIVNTSRGNTFRTITYVDDSVVHLPFAITNQSTGDIIKLYQYCGRQTAIQGTNETNLYITNHGLVVGDIIRNNSKQWQVATVTKVIDANHVEVTQVVGQASGDEIEIYCYVKTRITE